MLDAGRLDLVLTTLSTGLAVVRSEGYTTLFPLSPPLQVVPVYHYINAKNADLVEPLAAVLAQMDREGLLAKIRQEVQNELLSPNR